MEPVFRERILHDMKCVAYLLTALVVMWAASGHAQTIFPISENDVDVSGTVLMCPKSDIYAPSRGSTYAPCSGAGTLTHSVKVGGTPKLFAQVITPYREDTSSIIIVTSIIVCRTARDTSSVIIVTSIIVLQ